MANNAYAAIRLTGGTAGCLDDLIHTNITDGDIAFVMDKSTDKAYILYWDSSSTASESTTTPTIVVNPDSAPSTGRWLSTSLQSELLTGTAATDTKLMYQLVEKLATTSTGVSVTGLVACTTMNVGSTIAITGVLDEDAMGSDSAVSLATQQSIKAYVDTQVATQLANIVEDTTPQLGGDLDVNGKDITSPDGTDLIDIVDGAIDIQTASTSRLDINDSGVRMGASGSRVTTILDEDAMGTDSDTALATQQSIKAYVDASSASGISNVVEDTTPQLGGDLDMNGKGIDFPTTANITDCLDEDNMASDSATKLATQQSIKAYVDGAVGTPSDIGLDVALADADSSGLTIEATVDTNAFGAGALVMLGADGNYDTADADAEATCDGLLAIAVDSGTGASKTLLLQGLYRLDATYAWTVGATLYASTTVGEMTETAPSGSGDIVRIVGYAISADIIYFDPDKTYIEV